MPISLYHRLKCFAKKERRSMTQQASLLLEGVLPPIEQLEKEYEQQKQRTVSQ